MTTNKLTPLPEKEGHEIRRQVSEEFSPYCALCKRVVWEFMLETYDEARHYLDMHLQAIHGQKL